MIKVGDIVERKNGNFYRGKLQNEVTSISNCGDYLRVNGESTGSMIESFKVVDISKWHKHHDLIIAWAKGAAIQQLCFHITSKNYQENWCFCPYPRWEDKDAQFRIKPSEPTELEKLKAEHKAMGETIRKLTEEIYNG